MATGRGRSAAADGSFLVTALFVVLRLNKVFSWEIGLFILALVAVAEATLSVER